MRDSENIQVVVRLKVVEVHQEIVERHGNGKMLINFCHKIPYISTHARSAQTE
ncbi:hypothetical protein [Bartonella capreoli]|uniref:hypothetical protein n=1 Tax=Bartonella TaxID=773 RepID=UPI003CCC9DEC